MKAVIDLLSEYVGNQQKGKKRVRSEQETLFEELFGRESKSGPYPPNMVGLQIPLGMKPSSASKLHAILQSLRASTLRHKAMYPEHQHDAAILSKHAHHLFDAMDLLSQLNPTAITPWAVHNAAEQATTQTPYLPDTIVLLQNLLRPDAYMFEEKSGIKCRHPHCKFQTERPFQSQRVLTVQVPSTSSLMAQQHMGGGGGGLNTTCQLQDLLEQRRTGVPVIPYVCLNPSCPSKMTGQSGGIRWTLMKDFPPMLFVVLQREGGSGGGIPDDGGGSSADGVSGGGRSPSSSRSVRVTCDGWQFSLRSDFWLKRYRITAGVVRGTNGRYFMVRPSPSGIGWIYVKDDDVYESAVLEEEDERNLFLYVCENLEVHGMQ
ncbi:hypothetical protein HK102_000699 [Quaeritorhiza haematococci]|nr:hypothetical protein HK102_000699 [Quaeritorhiza haematococci]